MKNTNARQNNQGDLMWADEKLKDLIAGCELNFKLTNANICPKFIADMDQEDLFNYWKILEHIASDD
jgi:hypothetical protein